MYLLTDPEEERRTATTDEICLLNELRAMIFETAEEEKKPHPRLEGEEWKFSMF